MSVLWWWVPPLVATLLALAWQSWRAHFKPSDPHGERTAKELKKMKRALDKPMPAAPDSQQ